MLDVTLSKLPHTVKVGDFEGIMKVKDFIKPFLNKKVFETTVCITVDNEDLIFNVGDTLTDSQFIKDLGNKTVKHSSVCKDVLFIEIK